MKGSSVLANAVGSIVSFSTRTPWLIVFGFLAAASIAGGYMTTHFTINTDISQLISSDIDWRRRELTFKKQFPSQVNTTLIVVDGPTRELVSAAGAALTRHFAADTRHFKSVLDLSGHEFFVRNSLLFQPKDEVAQFTAGLRHASPLIAVLHDDPSLRGLVKFLSLTLAGVQSNRVTLDDLARPFSMAADTVDQALSGQPPAFSWMELLKGNEPGAGRNRHLIEVQPVLNFSALEPGKASSEAIRQAVADLDLASRYQARVRLTGAVPIGDEEFATVREGALVNGIGTILIVLLILWLALKSARIIGAVFLNLIVGLIITAALGLWMVDALNMISVAFAVLFVGLGVDFGIQFAVRYRTERHDCADSRSALVRAAKAIGTPLTLAAAAIAAGFLSFLPTDYRGLSELGQIAGVGMLVAYFTSITLLPALLMVLKSPGEAHPVGYRSLAPIDEFLQRRRIAVVSGAFAISIFGAPLLYFLTFDFNPIHLRSPSVESVSTLLDIEKDPTLGVNAINVLVPTVDDVSGAALNLSKLPEVAQVTTVKSLVPQDQPEKLVMIERLKVALDPIFERPSLDSPSDADDIAALKTGASRLIEVAGNSGSTGSEAAKRLAKSLAQLAEADQSMRARVQAAFIDPFHTDMEQLQSSLRAQPVSFDDLPSALKSKWVTEHGIARVQVSPAGNTDDIEVLRNFAKAVSADHPNAIGGPVSILESGKTIVKAFIHAGIYALLSITILLWIVLRRFGDVLLTLVPLILAGAVTLQLCVLIGLPLNFANIIALPLLLGVGVAFKIYYVMAWRAGQTKLLQSSLTHAVIWSALTTATAFGSLWLSNHPGTSSMGKLLGLSLVCTLGAAVLFQPALMGAPRQKGR